MPVPRLARPKVVVFDDWDGIARTSSAIERLAAHADVVVLGECDEEELVAVAHDAQVVVPIRERRRIGADLLARLPNLRHIAQTGGAAAHIDLEAAEAAGVAVSLTRGASSRSVAELVIALMIMSRRNLVQAATALSAGEWARPLGDEVFGTTIGVVGFGATGKAVAHACRALGLKVLVFSRRAGDGRIEDFPALDLDDLCERSEVVSLHLESAPSTRGIIGRPQLNRIGANGLLINAARADLVVREDLLDALERGTLGRAALDVFHDEPPAPDDPIVSHPSVLATPHLGWRTRSVMEAYFEGAVANILDRLQFAEQDREVQVR